MRHLLTAVTLLVTGCAASDQTEVEVDDWIFPADGKADGGGPARQPLVAGDSGLIDLRGLGDSAWAGNKTTLPLAPRFGDALDRFDATGTSYRGDVSFINWESVVGTRCDRFHDDSFGFLSDPGNITQVADRGFQLIGLSNNHTRDCGDSNSPTMTAAAMATVSAGRPIAWHGVSAPGERVEPPRILTSTIKGREVRIAFATLYLGRDTCPQATCKATRAAVLSGLRDADADLRVLAVHVLEFGTQWEGAAEVGAEFIREYDGDVVYGHGPHVWKPPLVVEKRDGSGDKGVVFTSLGNFIHPSLRAQANNMIGRALFDPETLTLAQIQVISVATAGGDASFGTTPASKVGSYGTQQIPWSDFEDQAGSRTLRGAFVNVP